MPVPDPPFESGAPDRNWANLTTPGITVPINDQSGEGLLVHQSNIAHNVIKYASRPAQIQECEGYKETCRREGIEVTRYYKLPWSLVYAATQYWLGYSTAQAGNTDDTGKIVRVPPEQDFIRPWLYASEVRLLNGLGAWVEDLVPALDAAGVPRIGPATDGFILNEPFLLSTLAYAEKRGSLFYDGAAHVEVTYRSLNYDIRTDDDPRVVSFGEIGRWVERRYNPSIQAIQIPANAKLDLKFVATAPGTIAGTMIPGNPVLLLPTLAVDYIWHDVPDVNHEVFRACAGKINDVAFDGVPGWLEFPIGTLLMNPARFERYRSTAGRYSHRIMMQMVYREVGWNHFPAADGKFYKATYGGTAAGELLYKYPTGSSFAKLFTPPAPVTY